MSSVKTFTSQSRMDARVVAELHIALTSMGITFSTKSDLISGCLEMLADILRETGKSTPILSTKEAIKYLRSRNFDPTVGGRGRHSIARQIARETELYKTQQRSSKQEAHSRDMALQRAITEDVDPAQFDRAMKMLSDEDLVSDEEEPYTPSGQDEEETPSSFGLVDLETPDEDDDPQPE